MMSFKQFLAQQEDTIDEMEAIQKYNEYKREFKAKQIKEFFEEHKDEDWYANKTSVLGFKNVVSSSVGSTITLSQ